MLSAQRFYFLYLSSRLALVGRMITSLPPPATCEKYPPLSPSLHGLCRALSPQPQALTPQTAHLLLYPEGLGCAC